MSRLPLLPTVLTRQSTLQRAMCYRAYRCPRGERVQVLRQVNHSLASVLLRWEYIVLPKDAPYRNFCEYCCIFRLQLSRKEKAIKPFVLRLNALTGDGEIHFYEKGECCKKRQSSMKMDSKQQLPFTMYCKIVHTGHKPYCFMVKKQMGDAECILRLGTG